MKIAFNILDDDDNIPVDYQHIACHMIFDAKLNFTRKASLVARGHVTDLPATATHAGVVSRESVRIILRMLPSLEE